MKKFLILSLLLGLGAGLAAKAAKKPEAPTVKAPEAEPAVAPLAPPWDKVQLKDGQSLEGKIRGYDGFFLEVQGKGGHTFSLPWREIGSLEPASPRDDLGAMKQYLSPEYVQVSSRVGSRDPGAAFRAAIWPGIIIHGYGAHVAGDQDLFLSLAGAEIFGAVIGGFGAGRELDGGTSADDKATAKYLIWGGGGMFVISWIWDLVDAPLAARAFNRDNNLSLISQPLPEGGMLLGFNQRF